jgi:predicted HD phosphohydrolase
MWDQCSFDPDYDMKPLEFFAPMVREVFAREANDPHVIRQVARVSLSDAGGRRRSSQTTLIFIH